MNLDTNNRSVYMLNYHLILVVKYRREVIDSTISERLKEIFEYISLRYKTIILKNGITTRTTFMYFLGHNLYLKSRSS